MCDTTRSALDEMQVERVSVSVPFARITGIDLRLLESGEIRLDQDDYLKQLDPIEISAARRREKNAKTTDREKSSLRALRGALLWPANLAMPKLSAAISHFAWRSPRRSSSPTCRRSW